MVAFQNPSKPVKKPIFYSKILTLTLALLVGIGTATATDLNNIETITPSGTSPINITGELNMESNNITNFFGTACGSGNVAVDVNRDGTIDCVDVSNQVSNDYVARSGDTMTGTLDMQGNNIVAPGEVNGVNLTNPGNAITISGNQYAVQEGGISHDNLAGVSSGDHHSRYTNEESQDATGTIMAGSGSTSVTYDDAGNAITVSSTNTQLDDQAAAANVDMNGNELIDFGQVETGRGGNVVRLNNPSGGKSAIRWYSGANSGSDNAFIRYHDNYISNGNSETSRLRIHAGNDGSSSGAYYDDLELSAANNVILHSNNGSNAGGGVVEVKGGSLTLNNNALTNVDWANSDNPDTTIADNQNLGFSAGSTSISNYATHTVSIDNGNGASIRDYYEADTTIADDQTLSTTADVSGTDDNVTISNGNTVTVDDDYAANSDASTKCGTDQVLEGGNTCVTNYESGDDGDSSSSNEIQGISSVVGQDSALNSGETIDASAGTLQLPVGTDAY